MAHRIAFWVARNNYMKLFAPVISHMLEHRPGDFTITLMFPGWNITKPFLQPGKDDFALFGNRVGVCAVPQPEDLAACLMQQAAEAVICISPELAEIIAPGLEKKTVRQTRRQGVRWLSLPHVVDDGNIVIRDPEWIVEGWDRVGMIGPRPVDFIFENLGRRSPKTLEALRERLTIVGYPELDGLEEMEPAQIRRKYGLPDEKPLLFLSTAPLYGPKTPLHLGMLARFRRAYPTTYLKGAALLSRLRYPWFISYRQYLEAVRRLADRNGMFVVAKTRTKHGDPGYLADYVDRIVGDVSYYPFTTLELMCCSSLYFGFSSATALEALAANVYALTAQYFPLRVQYPTKDLLAYGKFYYTNSIWNTPGVSERIDGAALSGRARLKRLTTAALGDFCVDGPRRGRLLDQYFHYYGCSSRRFADVLTSTLSGRGDADI